MNKYKQGELCDKLKFGPLAGGQSVHQWPGRPGFNPSTNHTKDSKMVIDATLLCSQHYKIRIKGKAGKYRNLARELEKLWNMMVAAISIVVGTLETVSKNLGNVFLIVIISAFRKFYLFFEFLVSVWNSYINVLYHLWDSFEWFSLQIISDAKYFSSLVRDINSMIRLGLRDHCRIL